MQTFTAGQANTVFLDVVEKADGDAITAGTVNFYLLALTGDNAGKWFRASDATWQAAEASAGAATYKGGSQWQLSIAADAWINGVSYSLYAKESGDLNMIYTDQVIPVSIAFLYETGAGIVCPVDLTEMKLHLRVTDDTEDSLIAQYMLAATSWAEEFQRRTYITRERVYYLDKFSSVIRPPYSPLSSVGSIQYVDTDGNIQTLDAAYYRVDTDSEPGRITEAYDYSWPDIRSVTNAVIVTYDSGYGAASDVPEEIKAAIKLLVGHFYEHREAVSEVKLDEVPMAIKSLLWTRKILN